MHPRLHAGGVDQSERDLVRTAARMQSMSLVISIDSMPAHLAGALGVPVWTLLPHAADWRWLERRADSPWYPTMRLFRQTRPGQWDRVLRDVHHALGEKLNLEAGHARHGHLPCFQ